MMLCSYKRLQQQHFFRFTEGSGLHGALSITNHVVSCLFVFLVEGYRRGF